MTSVVPSVVLGERDGAAVELDEAPAHGEPDARRRRAARARGRARRARTGRRTPACRRRAPPRGRRRRPRRPRPRRCARRRPARRAAGARAAARRARGRRGPPAGRAARTSAPASLSSRGQPAPRGAERLVERDQLGGRLGAPGRGQVEQVVDEALRALGAGRQPAQGVAELGIALAALLEHDEVAAQERDRLAELMRGLGRVGVEIRLGAAVGRRRLVLTPRPRRPARARSAGRTRP